MEEKLVAVIGAGVMGCATALDLAKHGCTVLLKDISQEILKQVSEIIKKEYRLACMMSLGYAKVPLKEILGRIRVVEDYAGIKKAQIIIENINEDIDDKIAEYKRLSEVINKEALFAINTSCISITKLAEFLPNSGRVIGVHLMNPVPLKKMVEVIRGIKTTKETEEQTIAFLRLLGKNPVVIDDLPGFVSNRLSHLFMNEAAYIVQEGIASAQQVDNIMKQGFGHKMGPLETADLIGLDTVVHSLDVLYKSYRDPKFKCCPVLKRMVDAGYYGRKNGKGFYEY